MMDVQSQVPSPPLWVPEDLSANCGTYSGSCVLQAAPRQASNCTAKLQTVQAHPEQLSTSMQLCFSAALHLSQQSTPFQARTLVPGSVVHPAKPCQPDLADSELTHS